MLCFQYCFHHKANKLKALKGIGNNGNKKYYIRYIYIIRHIRIYTYTPDIHIYIYIENVFPLFPIKKEGDKLEEQKIERRLKKEIELIGGKALKFVSPGVSGVPDRIVLLPGGKIIFVELKASGKNLSPIQLFKRKEFEKLGLEVKVIDSIDKVLDFIKEVV